MGRQETLIRQTHSRRTHLTPVAFAHFVNEEGQNSYDLLAQSFRADKDLTILDLGCGDGHLIPKILERVTAGSRMIGLDMVEEGLNVGRSTIHDPRVEFVAARAQAMPFADQSVDVVLSHMSLMLMSPLRDVARELRRVVKPGGSLHVVVSGSGGSGFYADLRRLFSIFVNMHIPNYRRSELDRFPMDGECEERDLTFTGDLDGLWRYVEGLYFWSLFPPGVAEELIEEIKSLARGYQNPAGEIEFVVPIRFNHYRF